MRLRKLEKFAIPIHVYILNKFIYLDSFVHGVHCIIAVTFVQTRSSCPLLNCQSGNTEQLCYRHVLQIRSSFCYKRSKLCQNRKFSNIFSFLQCQKNDDFICFFLNFSQLTNKGFASNVRSHGRLSSHSF